MTIRLPLADPGDRLRLQQWLSPAFPIGAFAYSQGLEQAISAGVVRDADALHAWVAALLRHGSGRFDAILLAQARHAGADLDALTDLTLAHASGPERVTELLELGRAFTTTINAITGQALPARPYPVAVGVATRALGLPTGEVVLFFLQAMAAQLVSVGVRFMPLGQTDGQVILARLAPEIVALAGSCAAAPLEALASTTPGTDLATMRHETMTVRIFRT